MGQKMEMESRRQILHRVGHYGKKSWVDFFEACTPLVLWFCNRKGLFDDDICHRILEMVMARMEPSGWKIDARPEDFRRKVLGNTSLIVSELQNTNQLSCTITIDDGLLIDLGSKGIEKELNERLTNALKIIANDKEVSLLHINVLHLFILGHTAGDIAESTGYSVSKIYAIKHYMMKMLARLLD